MQNQDYTINSVKKALNVLKIFASSLKTELTLMEICNEIDMNKSTALRILYTLKNEGFVKYDEETKKYSLGVVLFHLGNCVYSNMNLQKISGPYLRKLSKETNMIMHLVLIDSDNLVVIEKIQPGNTIQTSLQTQSFVGGILPKHCTGIGRLFLATKPKEELMNFLNCTELNKYTEKTIVDKGELLSKINSTKNDGFCAIDGEHEAFFKSISVPIYDDKNCMVAGLSAAGVNEYVDSLNFEEIVLKLKFTAKQISKELGAK